MPRETWTGNQMAVRAAVSRRHISGVIVRHSHGQGHIGRKARAQRIPSMHRRHLLLGASALISLSAVPAFAANPAEDFVASNIQAGFDILNDKALSAEDRKARFASFLLGLTDVKRVALFLLGKYAATTSPADTDAYLAAYQDYVLAVYQSYFAKYAGQSL